ncbi:MAG: hypothetical protein JNL38_13880 [Myxococcales bacterium]|nr:hypothetical protein [Myxococcales bacterium]
MLAIIDIAFGDCPPGGVALFGGGGAWSGCIPDAKPCIGPEDGGGPLGEGPPGSPGTELPNPEVTGCAGASCEGGPCGAIIGGLRMLDGTGGAGTGAGGTGCSSAVTWGLRGTGGALLGGAGGFGLAGSCTSGWGVKAVGVLYRPKLGRWASAGGWKPGLVTISGTESDNALPPAAVLMVRSPPDSSSSGKLGARLVTDPLRSRDHRRIITTRSRL